MFKKLNLPQLRKPDKTDNKIEAVAQMSIIKWLHFKKAKKNNVNIIKNVLLHFHMYFIFIYSDNFMIKNKKLDNSRYFIRSVVEWIERLLVKG